MSILSVLVPVPSPKSINVLGSIRYVNPLKAPMIFVSDLFFCAHSWLAKTKLNWQSDKRRITYSHICIITCCNGLCKKRALVSPNECECIRSHSYIERLPDGRIVGKINNYRTLWNAQRAALKVIEHYRCCVVWVWYHRRGTAWAINAVPKDWGDSDSIVWRGRCEARKGKDVKYSW
jgi:hypothetical protein